MRHAPEISILCLGASNLFRRAWFIRRALRQLAPKAEIVIACGPGRAYCRKGGIRLLRWYFPPLREIAPPPGIRAVLMMDLGSDLLYGASSRELLTTLHEMIGRFRRAGAVVVIVPIFETILESMTPSLFLALRSIYYSGSALTFDELKHSIRSVNEELRRIADEDSGILCLEGTETLLGWDRIHYRLGAELTPAIVEPIRRAIRDRVPANPFPEPGASATKGPDETVLQWRTAGGSLPRDHQSHPRPSPRR